MEIRSKTRER